MHTIRFLIGRRLLALCLMSTLAMTGCHMKTIDPSQYFTGPYLRAAKAIDTGTETQFKAAIAGIDVNRPGDKNITLLWFAIDRKNYAAIKNLIASGYRSDENDQGELGTPLEYALNSTDLRILQAMLDGGLSPNFQDYEGTTLLQRAMFGDKAYDRVRLLVERGADVNLRDNIGGTALHDALDINKPDIAIYLVEHGADVRAMSTNGVTIAYSLQVDIEQLDPQAPQAAVTDYTIDDRDKLVATTRTPLAPGLSTEGQVLLKKYLRLRDMLIERGVTFPAKSSDQVRKEMGLDW